MNNHIKIEAWKLIQKIIEKYVIFGPKWKPKSTPKSMQKTMRKIIRFLTPFEIRPPSARVRRRYHPLRGAVTQRSTSFRCASLRFPSSADPRSGVLGIPLGGVG